MVINMKEKKKMRRLKGEMTDGEQLERLICIEKTLTMERRQPNHVK